jgi:GT2 family glycosyltransferase
MRVSALKDMRCGLTPVAVVITNYNSWALAQKCAQSCLDHDAGRIGTLLVYDDCSTTPAPGDFPRQATVFRSETNLGLTRSLNAALRMTTENLVVVFDADAHPTTPFCRAVTGMFDEDSRLGLVAFRTIGSSGQPTESYTTEPNFWSILLGQALAAKVDRWVRDRSGRLSVFTCAMAFRRRAFDEIGGFDEAFDWLDLDHDFSMRMNRAGWGVAICPEPRVFHEGGGSPQLMRHRLLRFYKNRWYLLKKFDRIPAPALLRILIGLRLRIEYFILVLFGRLLFRDPWSREDKILGRKELIAFWNRN